MAVNLLGLSALAGAMTLGTTTLPALAQSCTSGCQSGQIQFTPGDRITVQVVNRSTVTIDLEQTPMTGPRTLRPGEAIELGFGWGTSPNISILFWPLQDRAIRLRLGRPEAQTLSVEIYSAPSEPSHRSIFVENDGRVILQ
ncbi:MAG: hypothetical protein ACHWZW_19615 [Spirulina sp.]